MEEKTPKKIYLGPPPKELVVADFYDLLDNIQLRTDETNRKLLLMQTIQGHANMADGKFRTNEDKAECMKYPNATIDDIAILLDKDKRLNMNHTEVKKKRYENIMEIKEVMMRIIKGERVRKLQNSKGKPLLGIPFFNTTEIKKTINIITGFYLGSIMDNYITWRKQLEKEPYNLKMGGGECVAVNMKKLNKETLDEILKENEPLSMEFASKCTEGFHLGTLANEEWGDNVQVLYDKGVVIRKDKVKATKYIKNAYVRHKRGKGVSDNAAIVMAGILYGKKDMQDGIEIALGVFLADAVDTLDKYVPIIHRHGLDESIGEEIRKSGKLNLTYKEKLNFIFFSAIHPKKKMPDCSQRYFLQIDEEAEDTAIENHLSYLKGNTPKSMIFGHKAPHVGVASEEFYDTIEEQLGKYKHLL